MRALTRLTKALRAVDAFAGRVYPVTAPETARDWPLCVWTRSGGELVTHLGAAVRLPRVQVDVLGDDYDVVLAALEDVMDGVERARLLYRAPDPPTDDWAETLNVYISSTQFVLAV